MGFFKGSRFSIIYEVHYNSVSIYKVSSSFSIFVPIQRNYTLVHYDTGSFDAGLLTVTVSSVMVALLIDVSNSTHIGESCLKAKIYLSG